MELPMTKRQKRLIDRTCALLLAAVSSLALLLSGCASGEPAGNGSSSSAATDSALLTADGASSDPQEGEAQRAAPVAATLEELAEQLYADVDNIGVAELDETLLLERFGVDGSLSPHWVARYAAKESYGVADFFIFQLPEDAESRDLLYQQLTAVQQERERYFENLDVFGSHDIAKAAQVTQAGNYLYLCMLPDQEAKLEQIQAFLAGQS